MIDRNIWLDACQVFMAPTAEIIIDPSTSGILFRIANTTPNFTIVQAACNNMWEGIDVSAANSSASIEGTTVIKDMEHGIRVKNSGVLLTTSTTIFEDNLKSIQLDELPNSNTTSISGTFRTTSPNLLPPHASNTNGRECHWYYKL